MCGYALLSLWAGLLLLPLLAACCRCCCAGMLGRIAAAAAAAACSSCSTEGLPSEEAGKSGEPGTGAGPAGLAQVGDPDATRACGVLSRASTAQGRSAPAGPRSPLRHGPRAAASRDARAQATRPCEPAYPRAAATGPAGRRKGGLQLPAEDRAARTTLRAGRTGVRGSVPGRHQTGPTWSGAQAGPRPSHQDLRSLDSRTSMEEVLPSRARGASTQGPAWRSGAARRSAVTSLPRARAFGPCPCLRPVGLSGPPTRMSRAFPQIRM
jgi:hypothetical protein